MKNTTKKNMDASFTRCNFRFTGFILKIWEVKNEFVWDNDE